MPVISSSAFLIYSHFGPIFAILPSHPPWQLTSKKKQGPVDSPALVLNYGCKPGRLSSQRVADLYYSKTALWSKFDLEEIGRQLE